jgi:3-hydroxyacyl-[acyl-carrier-protein] dehydratase
MAPSRWTNIDRVLSLSPGKSGVGVRNVTNTLSILDSHFPRFPVMPGVLILGSLGELASQVLAAQTGHPWRLARAEQVRFRHFVQPGDQMELSVEVKQLEPDSATCSGTVKVSGKPVTSARALRLVPQKAGESA